MARSRESLTNSDSSADVSDMTATRARKILPDFPPAPK